MSARYSIIQAIAYLDTRLSPRDLSVLGVLGAHADKSGYCWPSGARLGEWLGISRQAAQKSIAGLVDAGYIQRQARFNEVGGQTSNAYRVRMDYVPDPKYLRKVAPPATSEVAPPATSEVAPPATSEVALTTPPNDLIERPPPPTPSAHASVGVGAGEKSGGGEHEKNQTEPDPSASPPDMIERIIAAERHRLRQIGRDLPLGTERHIRRRLGDGPPNERDMAALADHQAALADHQRRRAAERARVVLPDTQAPAVQTAMRQALDALPPGLRRRAHPRAD